MGSVWVWTSAWITIRHGEDRGPVLLGTLLHHIITMQAAALLLATLAVILQTMQTAHSQPVSSTTPRPPTPGDGGDLRQAVRRQSDICYKCDQNVSKVSTLLKIKHLFLKKRK